MEEEEKKKILTIKIDCSVVQLNHSINITVLRDVKACSLENKYLCVRKTCCLHQVTHTYFCWETVHIHNLLLPKPDDSTVVQLTKCRVPHQIATVTPYGIEKHLQLQ